MSADIHIYASASLVVAYCRFEGGLYQSNTYISEISANEASLCELWVRSTGIQLYLVKSVGWVADCKQSAANTIIIIVNNGLSETCIPSGAKPHSNVKRPLNNTGSNIFVFLPAYYTSHN